MHSCPYKGTSTKAQVDLLTRNFKKQAYFGQQQKAWEHSTNPLVDIPCKLGAHTQDEQYLYFHLYHKVKSLASQMADNVLVFI